MPQKTVNLYRESQIEAWEQAAQLARDGLDDETLPDGDVLRHLADAYRGVVSFDD